MGYPPNDKPAVVSPNALVDTTPWEKMPSEPPRAYSAFVSYRNLQPKERSLKNAAISFYNVATSSKLRQMQFWSAKYMWVDRAMAWDGYVDRQARQDLINQIKAMNEKHIRTAQGMLALGIQRLSKIDPLELTPMDAQRFISEAIRLERMALGEPDSITKQEGTEKEIDLTFAEMDDNQLRQRIIQLKLKNKE